MINRALTNALLLAILCRLVDLPAWGIVLMAISFMDKMEDFCVDFGKGNISLRDMAEVLHDEHGVNIHFGRRESK